MEVKLRRYGPLRELVLSRYVPLPNLFELALQVEERAIATCFTTCYQVVPPPRAESWMVTCSGSFSSPRARGGYPFLTAGRPGLGLPPCALIALLPAAFRAVTSRFPRAFLPDRANSRANFRSAAVSTFQDRYFHTILSCRFFMILPPTTYMMPTFCCTPPAGSFRAPSTSASSSVARMRVLLSPTSAVSRVVSTTSR